MSKSTRGIGKEHPLVTALVTDGFSYREAHRVLNSMFDAIKAALKRHETVELPIGTLRVVPNKVQPYRQWRWGRPVEFYRQRFRIEFIPREEGYDE